MNKARATEGFLERARTAQRAYARQAAKAAEAVTDFAEEQGLAPGQQLTWCTAEYLSASV